MTNVNTSDGGTTIVPTVRNIEEAKALAPKFPAVLTVGPSAREVANFRHNNHHVLTFGDTEDVNSRYRPNSEHVESVIEFGLANDGPILVHCHMGISRSTSSALAILLARGADPEEATRALANIHPTGRHFAPNNLVVAITGELLGIKDLTELVNDVADQHWYDARWGLKYAPVRKVS